MIGILYGCSTCDAKTRRAAELLPPACINGHGVMERITPPLVTEPMNDLYECLEGCGYVKVAPRGSSIFCPDGHGQIPPRAPAVELERAGKAINRITTAEVLSDLVSSGLLERQAANVVLIKLGMDPIKPKKFTVLTDLTLSVQFDVNAMDHVAARALAASWLSEAVGTLEKIELRGPLKIVRVDSGTSDLQQYPES